MHALSMGKLIRRDVALRDFIETILRGQTKGTNLAQVKTLFIVNYLDEIEVSYKCFMILFAGQY